MIYLRDCSKCGAKCCRNIFLPIDKELKEWLEYHDIEVKEIRGITYAKINNPCKNLKDNKCSIYESRPEICKEYNCEENKEFL